MKIINFRVFMKLKDVEVGLVYMMVSILVFSEIWLNNTIDGQWWFSFHRF